MTHTNPSHSERIAALESTVASLVSALAALAITDTDPSPTPRRALTPVSASSPVTPITWTPVVPEPVTPVVKVAPSPVKVGGPSTLVNYVTSGDYAYAAIRNSEGTNTYVKVLTLGKHGTPAWTYVPGQGANAGQRLLDYVAANELGYAILPPHMVDRWAETLTHPVDVVHAALAIDPTPVRLTR